MRVTGMQAACIVGCGIGLAFAIDRHDWLGLTFALVGLLTAGAGMYLNSQDAKQ